MEHIWGRLKIGLGSTDLKRTNKQTRHWLRSPVQIINGCVSINIQENSLIRYWFVLRCSWNLKRNNKNNKTDLPFHSFPLLGKRWKVMARPPTTNQLKDLGLTYGMFLFFLLFLSQLWKHQWDVSCFCTFFYMRL